MLPRGWLLFVAFCLIAFVTAAPQQHRKQKPKSSGIAPQPKSLRQQQTGHRLPPGVRTPAQRPYHARHEGPLCSCGCPTTSCFVNSDCPFSFQFCQKPLGQCSDSFAGVCSDIPDDCDFNELIVCGCDGFDYLNPCTAALFGTNIAHFGLCNATECDSNDDCLSTQFCNTTAGNCGGAGLCVDIPAVCAAEYNPVCGCNGITYPSTCAANQESVSVNFIGACAPGTAPCASCTVDQYCLTELGDCDGVGTCAVIPPASQCTGLPNDLVCGCDDVTYANPCEAAAAGISVDAEGSCPAGGIPCSLNSECPTGQFCNLTTCDGTGFCTTTPVEATDCVGEYNPVCGCDFLTYASTCQANSFGVSVRSTGVCPLGFRPCTAASGGCDTSAREYCLTSPGACSGSGTCAVEPLLANCPTTATTVCGCDGNTYLNPCVAAAQGVSVNFFGSCSSGTGTVCEFNSDCPIGEFCLKRTGACSAPGIPGVCASTNIPCPPNPDPQEPVCGCNGLTYTSACIAQANGENIEYEGVCFAASRKRGSSDEDGFEGQMPLIQRKKAGTTPGSGIRKPPAKNQQKRKTVGNAQVGRSAKTLRTPQQAKHTQQQTKKQQQRQQASKKTTGQRRQQQLQQTMTSQQKLEQQRKLKLQQEKAKKMRQQQQQRQQPKRMQPLGAELEMMGAPEEEFEYLDAELDLGENYFMQSPQLDEYPRRRIDVETPPPEADEPEAQACLQNADCNETDYCRYALFQCSGIGECVVRPTNCTAESNVVCGCSGISFLNPCFAAQHGDSIFAAGPCKMSRTEIRERARAALPPDIVLGTGRRLSVFPPTDAPQLGYKITSAVFTPQAVRDRILADAAALSMERQALYEAPEVSSPQQRLVSEATACKNGVCQLEDDEAEDDDGEYDE